MEEKTVRTIKGSNLNMARYPKGSGNRPNQRNKTKTASSERANQTSSTDKRVANQRLEATSTQFKSGALIENDQSAPPKSPISNLITDAEREAQLNQIKTDEIEQKEDQKLNKAQNPTKIDEFDPEKTLKIAEDRKPMIKMILDQAEPALIYAAKDERGGWIPEVKNDLTEGLSLLSAILWPELDEMDERSKMLMVSCYTVAGASLKQIKHINKLRKEAIEKGAQKIESNNSAA